MQIDLDDEERRELRRKARVAVLMALEALDGEATRRVLLEQAVADGGFTERELSAEPPTAAAEKHSRLVDYQLSRTLTDLKHDGLLANPRWSVWRLSGAALETAPPALDDQPTAGRVTRLQTMPYREYLRTPEWRRTRAAALLRAGHRCSLDVTHTDELEVHHRTYERLGNELASDLAVLCRDCHRLHHKEYGRPRKRSANAPVASTAPPTVAPAPIASPPKRSPAPSRAETRGRRGSARRRRHAQSAIREFILRLCTAGGLVVGLLMGLAHRAPAVDASRCQADACLSAGLFAGVTAPLLYMAGGLLVGALIGALLARLVRLDRSP